MEKYSLIDNKEIKIVRRGISALVTYNNKKSPFDKYIPKQRCIWPNNIDSDSRIISRRVFGK